MREGDACWDANRPVPCITDIAGVLRSLVNDWAHVVGSENGVGGGNGGGAKHHRPPPRCVLLATDSQEIVDKANEAAAGLKLKIYSLRMDRKVCAPIPPSPLFRLNLPPSLS
jgi:hypothetical protein